MAKFGGIGTSWDCDLDEDCALVCAGPGKNPMMDLRRETGEGVTTTAQESRPASRIQPQRRSFYANSPLYECRATHTTGVRSGRHRIGRSASPGRIAEK